MSQSTDSLLIIRQAYTITRLFVLGRLLEASVGMLFDHSDAKTDKDSLVKELADCYLRDALSARVINLAMIEHWVTQVLERQASDTSGEKGVQV
jgi:hypothetical protein